jgi:hypothetical protein
VTELLKTAGVVGGISALLIALYLLPTPAFLALVAIYGGLLIAYYPRGLK